MASFGCLIYMHVHHKYPLAGNPNCFRMVKMKLIGTDYFLRGSFSPVFAEREIHGDVFMSPVFKVLLGLTFGPSHVALSEYHKMTGM